MGGGYVLDFSNRTFASFFSDEIEVNIDDPVYASEGTSKANRLRFFLRSCDAQIKIRTLLALWEYRQAHGRRNRIDESIPNAEDEFYRLIERLGGTRPANSRPTIPVPPEKTVTVEVFSELKKQLLAISELEPQPRGYAYERFLKHLFDKNGLSGRASFRIVGEQIDGSFELSAETYLLEAKWVARQCGADELRSFNGKVEEKAAWSRGLFISDGGFSADGIAAFGRGKRVICMDGLDLYEMLDRNLSFADVIARKVRRAAETGNPFVRLRELY